MLILHIALVIVQSHLTLTDIERVERFTLQKATPIDTLAADATGRSLLVCDEHGNIAYWSAEKGWQRQPIPNLKAICLTLSADGQLAVVSTADKRIRVYSVPAFEYQTEIQLRSEDRIENLAFLGRSNYLLCTQVGGMRTIFEYRNKRSLSAIWSHDCFEASLPSRSKPEVFMLNSAGDCYRFVVHNQRVDIAKVASKQVSSAFSQLSDQGLLVTNQGEHDIVSTIGRSHASQKHPSVAGLRCILGDTNVLVGVQNNALASLHLVSGRRSSWMVDLDEVNCVNSSGDGRFIITGTPFGMIQIHRCRYGFRP